MVRIAVIIFELLIAGVFILIIGNLFFFKLMPKVTDRIVRAKRHQRKLDKKIRAEFEKETSIGPIKRSAYEAYAQRLGRPVASLSENEKAEAYDMYLDWLSDQGR